MKISSRIKKIAVLVLAACMIMLSGCTTYDNFKSTFIEKNTDDDNVIYIGVYEPQSGEFSKEGNDEVKGIELANDVYSNVNGVQIKLVEIDNQSDVNASSTAIRNLIKTKPSAIIGSAGEASSMIASAYVKKAKIPTITPSAMNPLITQNNDYYFRACMTDSQEGSGLAEYAYKELGAKKIGIVTIKNDSSVSAFTEGFRSRLSELSHAKDNNIAFSREIDVDESGAAAIADDIKTSGADAVLLPMGAEKADSIFSKIEDMGLADSVTFLGNSSWSSSDFISMKKKHPDIKIAFPSDSVLGEDGKTTDTVTAETQRFLEEYKRKYGEDDLPTQNAVLGYDSYLLIINAINRANSSDPEKIRDALAETKDLRCATGVFTFDKNGNPVRSVNIATIRNSRIVSIYSTKSASEAKDMQKIN